MRWIFYSYSLITLDPLPSEEFESLKKAYVAKPKSANQSIWEAAIAPEGTLGPGIVLQPLSYRAHTPSLMTLHSNHRMTTQGTEIFFCTEIDEKNIITLQYQGQTLIAYSFVLCSLSVCESNCVLTCVCVYANTWEALPSHLVLHSSWPLPDKM